MSIRISGKQRRILELVADACIPREIDLGKPKCVIPFYSGHLPDIFDSAGAERRFLENLESRGLVRIERSHFIYIMDEGLTALGRTTAAGSPLREGGE